MAGMNLPLPQTVIQNYKDNVEMFPDYGDAHALYAQVWLYRAADGNPELQR